MKSSWTRRREQAAQAERSGKVLRRPVPRESASGPRAPLVQVNSSWTVMEPKHKRTAAQKELRFPNPLRTYLESKVSPGPVSCHRGLCRTAGVGLRLSPLLPLGATPPTTNQPSPPRWRSLDAAQRRPRSRHPTSPMSSPPFTGTNAVSGFTHQNPPCFLGVARKPPLQDHILLIVKFSSL